MLHMQRQISIKSSTNDCVSYKAVPASQATADDPRLKWARPEWIQQQQGMTKIPQVQNKSQSPSLLKPKQQALLKRVTYGSYSSSDSYSEEMNYSSSSSSSSSSSWSEDEQAEYPVLYQALGIDFGAQRVGIAVRCSSQNVPLLTLHRQQQQQQPGGACNDTVTTNTDPAKQETMDEPQMQQQGQQKQRQQRLLSLRRTAAVVLHLAMQEGCDGFILGLPVYTDKQRPTSTGAAAAKQQGERRLNAIIQTFAQHLADLAGPLHLPVLLVNEQQTSQQARAVMAGAAAYDVQVEQESATVNISAAQEPQQHSNEQQQQQPQHSKRLQQQQNNRIGRDAFAAALILSRYYNGLVTPLKQVQPQQLLTDSDCSRQSGTSWDMQQQGQAAADLKWMSVSPGEKRRRQQQRQRSVLAQRAAAQD